MYQYHVILALNAAHIQGEALYCFVTMNDGASLTDSTRKELITLIRNRIAPFAMPDFIQVRT